MGRVSWIEEGRESQAGVSLWCREYCGDKQLLLLVCVGAQSIPTPSWAAESPAFPCTDTKKTHEQPRLVFPSDLLSQATAVPRAGL